MGNHHSCEYNGHAIECVNSHKFLNANTKIGGLANHLWVIHLAMAHSKERCPSIHTGNPRLYTGCCNAILKHGVDAHHARVSVGNLGLQENLFVYFNIVCG